MYADVIGMRPEVKGMRGKISLIVVVAQIATAGLAMFGSAGAEPTKSAGDPPKDAAGSAIPPGDAWFCFSGRSRLHVDDRAGLCLRDPDDCERAHAEAESAIGGPGGDSDVTPCRQQAKAAVFTYFSATDDGWRALPTPSTELCALERRTYAKDADNSKVSACRLVGAVDGPLDSLAAPRFPVGDQWACAEDGRCDRDLDMCKKKDYVDAPAAYASRARCEKANEEAWQHGTALSRVCVEVGVVLRPGISPTRLPAGRGWFCSTGPDARCTRTTDDCQKLGSPCKTTRSAFAHDAGGAAGAVDMFPTLAACEAVMKKTATGSRCQPVE
jgi:hypothetical protein